MPGMPSLTEIASGQVLAQPVSAYQQGRQMGMQYQMDKLQVQAAQQELAMVPQREQFQQQATLMELGLRSEEAQRRRDALELEAEQTRLLREQATLPKWEKVGSDKTGYYRVDNNPLSPTSGQKELLVGPAAGTGAGGLTPYQEASLDLRRQELDLNRQRTEQTAEKEDRKAQAAESKQGATLMAAENRYAEVQDTIAKARQKAKGFGTTGFLGNYVRKIPGTDAYDLVELVKGITSNLSFGELSAMRQASPTGGALGNVSNIELEMLGKAVTSLETAQSEEQFYEALAKVEKHYNNWLEVMRFAASQGQLEEPAAPGQAPASGGKKRVKFGSLQ